MVAQMLVALHGDTRQGLQHAQPQVRHHHLHSLRLNGHKIQQERCCRMMRGDKSATRRLSAQRSNVAADTAHLGLLVRPCQARDATGCVRALGASPDCICMQAQ